MTIRKLGGVVALAVMVAGCQQGSDGTTPNIFADLQTLMGGEQISPQQSALRDQAEQHQDYAQARVSAAAAGAVIGGILGAALDSDNPGRGALLGAGIGGTAGYVGGSYLTRDHSDFVVSREALAEDIKAANEDTASSRRNVQVAQAALDYQRREIARLNEEYHAGELSPEAYERKLETLLEDRKQVGVMIATTRERITTMESTIASYRRSGYDPMELEKSNAEQRRHIASLREIENAMVDVIAGVPADVPRPRSAA